MNDRTAGAIRSAIDVLRETDDAAEDEAEEAAHAERQSSWDFARERAAQRLEAVLPDTNEALGDLRSEHLLNILSVHKDAIISWLSDLR